MLVDVLLRDKFLRDDDMAPRLSLPAKQLRRTLQFLEEEQIVKHELVDDLVMGGSQNTKVGCICVGALCTTTCSLYLWL